MQRSRNKGLTNVSNVQVFYLLNGNLHPKYVSIRSFTSVNPVIVHINGLRKIINLSLETFHANSTRYSSRVSGLIPANEK